MKLPKQLIIPVNPMPCPRPRLSRFGVYYPAKYNRWRKEFSTHVREAMGRHNRIGATRLLRVDVELIVEQPKKTELPVPKPDIDNYMKAVFDACNGILWADDSQIIVCYASKAWGQRGESGHVRIGVSEA
jgi:Holliday junction resolvase RusA-like endonuclease